MKNGMKGLTVSIYTNDFARPKDFGGGGNLLGECKRATIVGYLDEDGDLVELGPGEGRVSEPTEVAPAIVLQRHVGCLIAIPLVDTPEGTIGTMSGGAFVSSHDGRFDKLAEKLLGHRFYAAIPLHDRYESPETYAALSR